MLNKTYSMSPSGLLLPKIAISLFFLMALFCSPAFGMADAEVRYLDGSFGGTVINSGGHVQGPTIASTEFVNLDFQLWNRGNSTLYIYNPSSYLSGYGYSGSNLSTTSVAPNSRVNFSVYFSANSVGWYEGEILFSTNDADSPYSVNLYVEVDDIPAIRMGSPPEKSIFLNGATLNWGSIPMNTTVERTMVVHNVGTDPLRLDYNIIYAGTLCDAWSSGTNKFKNGTIVQPGQTYSFDVRYRCYKSGTPTGKVEVYSNDPGDIPFTLNFIAMSY